MAILFKETIGDTTVQMNSSESHFYVLQFREGKDPDVSMWDHSRRGMESAITNYNDIISQVLQAEAAKAEKWSK